MMHAGHFISPSPSPCLLISPRSSSSTVYLRIIAAVPSCRHRMYSRPSLPTATSMGKFVSLLMPRVLR